MTTTPIPDVNVVAATLEHVVDLAPRLRAADLLELRAITTWTPVAALKKSVQASDIPASVLLDGRVEAIFGAVRDSSGNGVIWMVTSDAFLKIKRRFIRDSRAYIQVFLDNYPVIYNYVHEQNTEHLKWLRWLGFEILPDQGILGLHGETLVLVRKVQDVHTDGRNRHDS